MSDQHVTNLVVEIGRTVDTHLDLGLRSSGVPSDEYVFDVLNALAICSAAILCGTGCDPHAVMFFSRALSEQLRIFQKENSNEPADTDASSTKH